MPATQAKELPRYCIHTAQVKSLEITSPRWKTLPIHGYVHIRSFLGSQRLRPGSNFSVTWCLNRTMALCWKGACTTGREMRQSTLEADEPGVGDKSDSRLGNAGVGDKYRTFSKKQLRSLWMFVNWEERQARREQRADHFIDNIPCQLGTVM